MARIFLQMVTILALSSFISTIDKLTANYSTTTQIAVFNVTVNTPENQFKGRNANEANGSGNNVTDTEYAVMSHYLAYIITPFFFVMGVCGNAMTILVMISRRFKNKTSSYILIALAVSDSTFSFVVPFNKLFFRTLLGYDPRALTSFGCSAFFVVHKTSKITSSWFVVFISVERFIAICFPFKAKFICTRRNAVVGILFVYVAIFALACMGHLSTAVVNNVCIPNHVTDENAELAEILLFVGTFVYSYIPCIIMLILTPITCFHLVRQASLRRRLSSKNYKGDDTAKMTAMLIGVTIAFVVLVTPVAVAHNVAFSMQMNLFETDHVGMMVAREILLIMEQLNYSINFLLYVMCSADFRQRVAEILRCRKLEEDHLSSHFSGVRTVSSSVIHSMD